MHRAAFDFESGSANRKLRGAVHLDAAGEVDGFVLFKHGEKNSVKVDEMVALTPEAQLAFWSFLGHMDRVTTVTFNLFHPEDPVVWALTDMNRVKTTEVEEFLWLRVLDVPRCLAARPWAADGTVVLEVDDAQGHASGRYELTTSGGVATVSRTDRPADVRLTAETLASLYLGEVEVRRMHHAGRVEGAPDAVARLGAMADLSDPPYSLTGF
jgi:predicted acetyltransferase